MPAIREGKVIGAATTRGVYGFMVPESQTHNHNSGSLKGNDFAGGLMVLWFLVAEPKP